MVYSPGEKEKENNGKGISSNGSLDIIQVTVSNKKIINFSIVKVGTHDWTSPCNKSPEEFTQRDWLQGLVPGTVLTKCFEEQVTGTKGDPCDQIWKQRWPVHTMGLVPATCSKD